jgi:hypothetical protein
MPTYVTLFRSPPQRIQKIMEVLAPCAGPAAWVDAPGPNWTAALAAIGVVPLGR